MKQGIDLKANIARSWARSRTVGAAALILLFAAGPVSAEDGPFYARGNFLCLSEFEGTVFPDTCFGYGSPNKMADDGQHGDGAAGDGVYGVWIACNQGPGMLQFKIANADWTFSEPTVPGDPLVNCRIFTATPGETVHFRLDLNPADDGWLPPIAIASDHGYPAGSTLELIGSGSELGNWTSGVAADHFGTIWEARVMIATPGTYEYKFRVQGTWAFANFGYHYNNLMGDNGVMVTTRPDQAMVVQFDELTGRIRAVDAADVPVEVMNWGTVRALYR